MSIIGTKIETFTSKSGKEITIRFMAEHDAAELMRYINEVSLEDTFITFSGEQVSLEEEEEYLKSVFEKVEDHNMLKVVAEFEGKIIGAADMTRDLVGKKRSYHVAGFGLSVAALFRGEGIGEKLMRVTIEQAKIYIEGLRIITLTVYEPNSAGQSLYKKVGFEEYGRLTGGVLYRGEYFDAVKMSLQI